MKPRNDTEPTTAELFDMLFGLPQRKYVRKGYAVTANLSIPAVVFKKTGSFNQQKLSGGDSEFCYRARADGFELDFEENAFVIHPARIDESELITKQRRVKGGQVSNLPLLRRLKYGLATFLPPIPRVKQVVASPLISAKQKYKLICLLFRLYWVGITEYFRLLFGSKPERK